MVYDVMDDLASFAFASPQLKLSQRRALRRADLVFAGGRSLYAGVASQRPEGVHLFPSGVDQEHYARAVGARRQRTRPVAGYVGVIDEQRPVSRATRRAARPRSRRRDRHPGR